MTTLNGAKSIGHCLERATAAVNAERHCPVFVSSNPIDERVLDYGIPQVVNECVTEAMEGLPRVSDAQSSLVTTEPLRRGMAQLAPDSFQFGEEAVCSSSLYGLDVLQQAQVDQGRVQGKDSPAAGVLRVLALPAVVNADARDALLLDQVAYPQPTNLVFLQLHGDSVAVGLASLTA